MKYEVQHLVLSGGGLKGMATLGAIQYALRKQLFEWNKIRSISGTSVGGLIGALLVIGYTPKDLFTIAKTLDFEELVDPELTNLVADGFGIETGEKLLKYIGELFEKKGISIKITMRELYDRTKIRLIVVVTNVNKRCVQYLDYTTDPALEVLTAIRATISIPFLFTAVKHPQTGDRLVDGGLLSNFPLDIYKHIHPARILAFAFVRSKHKVPEFHSDIDGIKEYTNALLDCLLTEMADLRALHCGPAYPRSTIEINTRQIHSLDLNGLKDKKTRQKLFKTGMRATKKYTRSSEFWSLKILSLPENIQAKIKELALTS